MKKTLQTVVVPEGAEGAAFLRRLLMPEDGDLSRSWEAAHRESPGDDITIEENDEIDLDALNTES